MTEVQKGQKNKTLAAAAERKSTNIQWMRFLAAIGVLCAHAHVLADGSQDLLYQALGITWGSLAVSFFFFVSGLYISRTLERGVSAGKYFMGRIRRIILPLAIVILLTVFILGPCVSSWGLQDYLGSSTTWRYLLNILLVPVHILPGVFEENIASRTVNGSLWTLPLEFICYIGLFCVYRLFKTEKSRRGVLTACTAAAGAGTCLAARMLDNSVILSAGQAVCLFLMGALYYVFREQIQLKFQLGAAALGLWILLALAGAPLLANVICLPMVIAVFLIGSRQLGQKLSSLGDLSYALYLTAFPIQQTVIWLFHGKMSPYLNMLCSIPIAVLSAAVLSRVEKRMNAHR